ncbi:hypothetical protein JTB14_028630 [Gonioctena quinquepunctata]|nr:hypothetical protein JTB14_028630 [Gonioctena quinquepunctata]
MRSAAVGHEIRKVAEEKELDMDMAESKIDITISNARAANQIMDWKVEGNLTTSDHNLISLVIQKTRTDDMGPMVKKYDMHRANRETLKAEFDAPRPEGNEDVHEYAKRIAKEIKRVMDLAIPQTYSAKYARNDAWSVELTRLRGQNYIAQIAETKARSWERFVQTHLATDAWGMPYKIVTKKIRCSTMLSSLEREDGSMTGTWEESAELLVNTLLPSDVHEGETAEQQEARREMVQVYQEPPETILYPFTENEIEECLCTMKKKKAPGPDNITTEVLLALKEKLIPALCVLYNECLRRGIIPKVFKQSEIVIISKGEDKDPSKAKSYRPICLLNSMGKLQEKLLCKRLKEHRKTIGVHPDQYGYRSGRSTEDAINKAPGIVDESENKYVVAIFIDISGAFDNLWWLHSLEDSERCSVLGRCIKASEVTVKTGSVCGPVFWDIMLEELLEQLSMAVEALGTVAYADDLLILVEAESRRELERKGDNVLDIVHMWCGKVKLKISVEKTTYNLIKGQLRSATANRWTAGQKNKKGKIPWTTHGRVQNVCLPHH